MKPVLLLGPLGATAALTKARISGYTRSDGTYVQEHQDSRPDGSRASVRVPTRDGKIATKKFDGPEHEAASHDAVENPLYHKDADAYGGAPPSRIEFERKGVSHVDADTIISPQRSLNPRKINRIASEFDDDEADPVHLIRMPDGRHSLAGGNHRTVSAIMSGRSKIKAHVIDHSEINGKMKKSILLFGAPGTSAAVEDLTKAQVKGYTRADGTYVKPHTTSRAAASQSSSLEVGTPVKVTGQVGGQGKTGVIYETAPSGKFHIVKFEDGSRSSYHESDLSEHDPDDYDDEDEGDDDDMIKAQTTGRDSIKKSVLLFGDGIGDLAKARVKGYTRKDGTYVNEHDNGRIEAHGVKGMKSTPWRKTFKSQKHFEDWLDKNEGNVEVHGTRKVDD